MATPIRMPALTQTSGELRLTAWLKTEGEQVAEGEPLFEAETDKAELEVEATTSGTLLRWLAGPGEAVSIGTVVAWIGRPGEDIPQADPVAPEAAAAAQPASPSAAAWSPDSSERLPATPAARTLARVRGIDLSQLAGSGPGGRIERRDVLAVMDVDDGPGLPPADAGTTEDAVPAHRRAIAARLSRAATVPQFTVSRTVDARPALARTEGLDGVTLTHVLLQAAATALRAMPDVNRVWLDDGPRLRKLPHCHVGLAIAADDNLIVATIPEPDRLGLEELARTTRRAVAEGRRGRLTAASTAPAAMTLSNLGMFGVDRFEAIVDPDQTAILAVGRVVERPAVTAGGIAAVPQLDLALTVDHRTVDGATAARFLAAICAELERR
ncbi:MAG TPA: dihydrolipoamide acetyltransferase family protein [Trebonia sp.]|jgi:pyruvate dehydrogenase E2 component (dihydrolipoamide acetyltransferase)|nr:dihydrolipoamide acetyltransferase family protein [Trebonia sp.]